MAGMTAKFRVYRFTAGKAARPHYDQFTPPVKEDPTVLDALFAIQEQLDPSLAFRFSCRGAVCGSCAMRIGGKIRLACRTRVASLGAGIITLAPLPHLPVVKDLVVDMGIFWKHYRAVIPWLEAGPTPENAQGLMAESIRRRIDQYINCILCGACYGACPVSRFQKDYLGPASLAKAYRFLLDPRDRGADERLTRTDASSGAWGCHQVYECSRVCPKAVKPSEGIAGLKRALLAKKTGTK